MYVCTFDQGVESVQAKEEDVIEILAPGLPQLTLFLDSSTASSTTSTEQPKPILKKVTVNPTPSAAWVAYDDGSMKEMPSEMLDRLDRVAYDFASTRLPARLTPGFRGTGRRDLRDPNISGGSLGP